MKIINVRAREILDSRSTPTVEADVVLENGIEATAAVPSGASTGQYEAVELRDGEDRYGGKGVRCAVTNVNEMIAPALAGWSVFDQEGIDRCMRELDGTANKEKLGANAILAVSLAAAKAAAKAAKLPLYRYLGGCHAHCLPMPMMNILNGGAHADNTVDIQEFMIMPVGAESEHEAVRMGAEIFSALKRLLKSKGHITSVGDEGGFAPALFQDEEALDILLEAVKSAGYQIKTDVMLALDVAASQWYDGENYHLPKSNRSYSTDELISYFENLISSYPIYSIEDPLSEEDWDGWQKLTKQLGTSCQIVGDDLFVTNRERIEQGIRLHAANAVLIKVNQIGTLTETLEAVETAHRAGYKTILSHRSGETGDTSIADIAVATGSGQIKAGAPSRCDRTEKYNRLMRIEEELSKNSSFYSIKI